MFLLKKNGSFDLLVREKLDLTNKTVNSADIFIMGVTGRAMNKKLAAAMLCGLN